MSSFDLTEFKVIAAMDIAAAVKSGASLSRCDTAL